MKEINVFSFIFRLNILKDRRLVGPGVYFCLVDLEVYHCEHIPSLVAFVWILHESISLILWYL